MALTKELAIQLIELLKNDKKQVKYGSLNAILQYSASSQQKLFFKDTDLMKLILKNILTPELTKICLSNLINLSSQEIFKQQFIKFIEPLILQLKQFSNLQSQLTLLFLLNISQLPQIIHQIIGEGQKQGYALQILYAIYEKNTNFRWIIANIFANITSQQQGRDYLLKNHFYLRFLPSVREKDQKIRIAILKLFRNMSFMWENQHFIKQILSQEHRFLDKITQIMAMIIHKANLLKIEEERVEKLVKTYCPIYKQNLIETTKQESITSLQVCIDIILILSNSNFSQHKPPLEQQLLRQLISFLKFIQINQQSKDKLQALQIFCFW